LEVLILGFDPLFRGNRKGCRLGIIPWIVFGLIAGFLAKFLMPGKLSGGIIVTNLLGIEGAVVDGFLGTLLGFGDVSGFDWRSMPWLSRAGSLCYSSTDC